MTPQFNRSKNPLSAEQRIGALHHIYDTSKTIQLPESINYIGSNLRDEPRNIKNCFRDDLRNNFSVDPSEVCKQGVSTLLTEMCKLLGWAEPWYEVPFQNLHLSPSHPHSAQSQDIRSHLQIQEQGLSTNDRAFFTRIEEYGGWAFLLNVMAVLSFNSHISRFSKADETSLDTIKGIYTDQYDELFSFQPKIL